MSGKKTPPEDDVRIDIDLWSGEPILTRAELDAIEAELIARKQARIEAIRRSRSAELSARVRKLVAALGLPVESEAEIKLVEAALDAEFLEGYEVGWMDRYDEDAED